MESMPLIDTDAVKKCRKPDEHRFKVDGHRMLLIYTAPKFTEKRLRSHIRSLADETGVEIRVFHEAHPTRGKHTYVLAYFNGRFQTSSRKIFDVGMDHPTILAVRCKTDWQILLSYFPDEDEVSEQVSEEEGELAPLTLSDMKHWQQDVIALMRDNIRVMRPSLVKGRPTKDCKINVVLTRDRCGRSTLVSALKEAKPTSIHVIDGIVDMEELVAVQQIPHEEWDKQTLIINIGHTSDIKGLRAMYVFIDSTMLRACCDIWIFCNLHPVVTQDEKKRIVMYDMGRTNWENGQIGQLVPMELGSSKRA